MPDDLDLRYYAEQRRVLTETATEFALAHPDRAPYWLPNGPRLHDPYVDRLLEAGAFNLGRVWSMVDAQSTEQTSALVSLLWPNYQRTLPSMAMVEFNTREALTHTQTIHAGLEVLSRPIGPKRTQVRYRTTREIALQPFTLEKAYVVHQPDGRSALRWRFACHADIHWQSVKANRLPIYLNAEASVSAAFYYMLTHHIQTMRLRLPNTPEREISGQIQPLGLAETDRLWPSREAVFNGYNLLLEYFSFRDAFMFVELEGLPTQTFPSGIPWFEIDLILNTSWPDELPCHAELFSFSASPVINLFNLNADPIIIDGNQGEILLRPLRLQDGHTEIYTVDTVQSTIGMGEHYLPFNSFQHYDGMLREGAPARHYHTRVRQNQEGLSDTWLLLGGEDYEVDCAHGPHTLLLQMTGTQGQLPHRGLTTTLLDHLAKPTEHPMLQVRNLTQPKAPLTPPVEDRLHWRVMAHLGMGFISLLNHIDRLRGILGLYDWTDDEMNRRRLDSLMDIRYHIKQTRERGQLRRGIEIDLTLNSDGFHGIGDIWLFGAVLNQFFALYADLHLFNQLTLHLQPSGDTLSWPPNYSQIS